MFNGTGYGDITKMSEAVTHTFERCFNLKVLMGVLCSEFSVMHRTFSVKNIKKLRKMFLEQDEGLF